MTDISTNDTNTDLINSLVARAILENPPQRQPDWSSEEIYFLHANHAKLHDFDIAKVLGRSENAIKIFRVRQGLPAPCRAKTYWITSNEASKIVNVEVHALTGWCDMGMIPFILGGPNRLVRMVRRSDLTTWCVNPMNWVYFDWRKVTDPHIRRLCELRSQRWNDEWWTTRQVAEYHGVDVKDVTRWIFHRRIEQAYCPPISKGGRHPNRRWAYWYVKKSVAIKLKFIRRGDDMSRFTPRADSWLLKARNLLHMPWEVIGRSMGSSPRTKRGKKGRDGVTIKKRYEHLMSMIGQAEDALFARR